jgi:pimeloyl-ACP methyl ester carboxylesterase
MPVIHRPASATHPARSFIECDQGVVPTVDVDGIATHYEISGSGPPILMMAPGGFDSAIEKWSTTWPWQHFLPLQIFAPEYTCIAYDRREAGQSGGRLEQLTWAAYADQAKGLLDHLGVASAFIMGSCLGCFRAAADRDRTEPFVVSDDRTESDLTPMTDANWAVLADGHGFHAVATMNELTADRQGELSRTELWWFLLLLILGMLIAEVAMTRKMVQGGHAAIEPMPEPEPT